MSDTQFYKKQFVVILFVFIVTTLALLSFSWYYMKKDSKNKPIDPLSLDLKDIEHLKTNEKAPISIQMHVVESAIGNKIPKAAVKIDSIDSSKKDNAALIDTSLIMQDARESNETQDFAIQNDKHLNSTKNRDKSPIYIKNPQRYYKKPKVVIIIDDLATKKDIKLFESLHLRLTPSLLPKHFFSKDNPDVAKTLDFYMIHLPLEAHNFEQQDVTTLHVGDSPQTIESYITQIKKDFPTLTYINNHTGSRYTESIKDMQELLQVLTRHGIIFVDSLTTSKSVVGKLLKKQNKIHLARNVFLDNEVNTSAIRKQLNKALRIADKQGYVIAIGHPKQATYQVLKEYKEILLNDYEMLYINELDLLLQQHEISDTKTPLPLLKQ